MHRKVTALLLLAVLGAANVPANAQGMLFGVRRAIGLVRRKHRHHRQNQSSNANGNNTNNGNGFKSNGHFNNGNTGGAPGGGAGVPNYSPYPGS